MTHIISGSRRASERGFTLIELSIVLVIIGLIVGGILVGQDLIKGAEIRATIAQIEKYNTAVNTFRNKYNGIPGDIATASASQFGLFSVLGGGTGQGDGNGLVEGGASTATSAGVAATGETVAFWRHLSDAGYVDGSFGSSLTSAGITCASSGACGGTWVPTAKMGRGNLIIVNATAGNNYFGITNFTASTGTYTGTNAMTPLEAYNIDKKVDDGSPLTGSVTAFDAGTIGTNFFTVPTTTSQVNANCQLSSAYYVSGTQGSSQNCALRMRFN